MFSLIFASVLTQQPKLPPLLLTHYLPWYENKAVSGKWGWHWTMNHFDPDHAVAGRQDAASAFRPMIGLYDSKDADVIEYQVLLMKIAGLDGAIIDWYGDQDQYDYLNNDRNSAKVIGELIRAGMKFAILYEDQTVPNLIKGGKTTTADAVQNARGLLNRLQARWFRNPAYVKLDGRPLFLVFGPQYYKDQDWTVIFSDLKPAPAFFTLMFKRGPAVGAYSWPTPQKGDGLSWKELDMFNDRAKTFTDRIDVAYPRFKDVYREAGNGVGYPEITDRGGKTYRDTFTRALAASPWAVQIATWNDWGEGTQIEPSVEFGYRDLEITQQVREKISGGSHYQAADLRLPAKLLVLRRRYKGDRKIQNQLDQAFNQLVRGRVKQAAAALKSLE